MFSLLFINGQQNFKAMKKDTYTSTVNGTSAASSAQSTNDYMQYARYRCKQAHGWAAEDANAMSDRLSGKNVDQVGHNNSKNGADRICNGIEIQTKYCKTPTDTVNAAFENGEYRYGGMKLEVPKDQYDECVRLMADKIRTGQVSGVSDPAVAKDIVVKGSCTYKQAVNIAKPGTLDSVKFDLRTQSVSCSITCGFTFVLSYTNAVRSGKSHSEAIKCATIQSAKSGGISLTVGVGTQQLLRTTIGRNIAASATHSARSVLDVACKTQVGQKAVEATASALVGKEVVGQAAKQILVKGMRTNMVTGGVMLAVQTIPDAVKLCKGKMSSGEFVENTACNAAGIGGGYAGGTVGAAIGTFICPGIGTVIGGFVGGLGGGFAGSSITKGLFSIFN